jgi:hemolysin activation/secretion protein
MKGKETMSTRTTGFALSLLAIACLPAAAQTPPNASRALEIISTPPDLAGKAQVDLPKPESPQAAPVKPAEEAGYSFLVKDFRLLGAKRFSETELKALLAGFAGRKITLSELNAGTDRITKHYRDHNLPFVQVFIPPQDVTEGVVEIRIVEGRVGKIDTRIAPDSRIKPEIANWLSAALPVGAPIDYNVLTRSILLLNDLPGIQAKVDLGPGEAIGDVGLLLNASDRGPLANYSLDVDNHGTRTVGAARIGGTLRLNNMTGGGDQLIARLQHSAGNGVNSGQLSYQRPVGYNGLKLGGQISKTRYKVIKDFTGLDGDGVTWNLNASYPLQRSRGKNLNLNAALEHRDLNDPVGESKLNVLMFGVDGDFSDNWRGGGVTSYTAGINLGEVNQNSLPAIEGGYAKFSWDVQRRQFLNEKNTLLGRIRGQLPGSNLHASEKLSLGGPNGVRAYPVSESSSDEAAIASLEWQYALGAVGQGFNLIPSVFADYGYSRRDKNPTATGNTRNLWGLGVGLMAYKPGRAQFSASLAWRGTGDNPESANDQDRFRLWLQAVISF